MRKVNIFIKKSFFSISRKYFNKSGTSIKTWIFSSAVYHYLWEFFSYLFIKCLFIKIYFWAHIYWSCVWIQMAICGILKVEIKQKIYYCKLQKGIIICSIHWMSKCMSSFILIISLLKKYRITLLIELDIELISI